MKILQNILFNPPSETTARRIGPLTTPTTAATTVPPLIPGEVDPVDPFQRFLSSPYFLWSVIGVVCLLIVIGVVWSLRMRKEKQPEQTQVSPKPEKVRQEGCVGSIQIAKVHGQGARNYQEDSFGVSDAQNYNTKGVLAVVADGMGGLKHGNQVSQAAVEAALDGFLYSQGQGTPEQVLLMLLHQVVQKINAMMGPNNYRKSGSTLLMGLVWEQTFSWVSVGDSRIYLYRDDKLVQLTREHDFKQKLALRAVNGEIPMQEVYTDKRRDGLISYLGMGPLEYLDLPANPLKLAPGDQIVLMTDGVYNALSDQELIQALRQKEMTAAEAIEKAIAQKAYRDQDNYTVVLLSCDASPMQTQQVQGLSQTIDNGGMEAP